VHEIQDGGAKKAEEVAHPLAFVLSKTKPGEEDEVMKIAVQYWRAGPRDGKW
jgi:hypothetical protein